MAARRPLGFGKAIQGPNVAMNGFFASRVSCITLAGLVLAGSLTGCNRAHYREQADDEAGRIVIEKSNDDRWALDDFTIEMDSRSRFYDGSDPDYPPMPEDDPASHEFMHCVDGHRGWKHWHDHGDTAELENPYWQQCLGEYAEIAEDGAVKLTLNDAVRLALIHSPDYQEQLETIYLSALDVSTERFRFDVQFFGGFDLRYNHLGEERGPNGESNTVTFAPDFSAQRRFATAGQLLVGFANSTVWQFTGPNTGFTTSILNFNLVQPLLRGGGRVIALEQLTIAERGLLANLRAFQRYRQGFYTEIAVGESNVSEPQRRGGFFGGTGLTGFTGQGSGGFGGVGDATGFGRGGFGGTGGAAGGGTAGFAGGGAGQVGGFIGLLQQSQQIRNTEDSLGAQLRTLALLEANLAAGLIDIAQVDQFRQNIETERANLLQARNSLETALDTFKASTLGLPPALAVELDDSLIRPFRFLDPQITSVQDDIAAMIERFGDLPTEPTIEQIDKAFDEVTSIQPRIAAHFGVVKQDLASLDSAIAMRQQVLTPAEQRLLDADKKRLAESLADLEQRFATTGPHIAELRAGLNEQTRRRTADSIVTLLVDLSNLAAQLSLTQARARVEGIVVEPLELDSAVALEIARANRLDWMNNRAALVDTWRLIEFNANALKSDLTIGMSGDIQTLGGDNPFKFRDENGSLEARLSYDAPLTRLVERNNFRQQLIEYQQDRRQLVQFEDGVSRTLRQTLRSLKQLQVNLDIQRRALAISIRRVDQTREVLNRPVPPSVPGQPPAQLGPTAAVNLLTALSDLRNTQNNFMSVWLNYEATRMLLLRELGVMRLDENNVWIDEPLDQALRAAASDYTLPPEVPPVWLENMNPLGGGAAGQPVVPPAPAEDLEPEQP
ncbi:MAG: hypothetical protein AB7O26_08320 [Planctomycetaceae bacterium]